MIPCAFRPLGRGGSSPAELLLHLDAIENQGSGQPHSRNTSVWFPVNNTGDPLLWGDMRFSAFGWHGGYRGLLQCGGVQKFNFEICFRLHAPGDGTAPESVVIFGNNITAGGESFRISLRPNTAQIVIEVRGQEHTESISYGVNTVCIADNKVLFGGDNDLVTLEIPGSIGNDYPGEFWLGTDAPNHLNQFGDPVYALHSLKIRDKPMSEQDAYTAIAENFTRFSPTCAPVVFNPNGLFDWQPTTNLSCATPGATVRVQYSNWIHDPFRFEEGIIPANPFPAYNGTSMTCRLKALASKDGMEDSPVVLSEIFLND